jgi:predicted Zn-dependent protease
MKRKPEGLLPGRQAIMSTLPRIYLAAIILLLAGLSLLSGCAVNKATGERQFNLYSRSQEIEMGREADEQITASMGMYEDTELQDYVSRLGQQLAASSERPDLPWTFRVLDDPVVNAFALPGGFIYVTRGILVHFNSEAELAGVLGHEIGHVTGKHSVNRLSKQQLAQLGIGVGVIIEPDLKEYGQIASAGLQLLFLKFSRDDERQADILGLRYMRRVDYDPSDMVGVMSMLDRVTEARGGRGVPEWLATHPDPGNRQEYIRAAIDTMTLTGSFKSPQRTEYLQMIEGVVYGQDPRNGYFEDGMFYHPDLRFKLRFPDGWETMNQAQVVAAISPQEDAIVQLTLSTAGDANTAARQFAGQDGISADPAINIDVNGLSGVRVDFAAQTRDGVFLGTAVFIDYADNVYQILGYSAQNLWRTYEGTVLGSARSFGRLNDPARINVEPMRVQIVTLEKPMTLTDFVAANPSPVSVDELAVINRVDKTEQLPSGFMLKHVVK